MRQIFTPVAKLIDKAVVYRLIKRPIQESKEVDTGYKMADNVARWVKTRRRQMKESRQQDK